MVYLQRCEGEHGAVSTFDVISLGPTYLSLASFANRLGSELFPKRILVVHAASPLAEHGGIAGGDGIQLCVGRLVTAYAEGLRMNSPRFNEPSCINPSPRG